MTAAQSARQDIRDRGGRYAEDTRAEAGTSVLAGSRFPPPSLTEFEFIPDSGYTEGSELLAQAYATDRSGLEEQITQTLPHLSQGRVRELAFELVACRLTSDWMTTEGDSAAFEAQAYDEHHPGDFPLLRVDHTEYADFDYDDEPGYDWAQIAQDNAAACDHFAERLWRVAEAEDRKLATQVAA